jgi:cation transport protein ChaC
MTWIFGYGSLTFDDWEKAYHCVNHVRAELRGYRRSFNKRSVVNWGTKAAPGITLNLEPASSATCVGIAFEFRDTDLRLTEAMLAALKKREACGPTPVQVSLSDGRTVHALTYIYAGPNLLDPKVTLAQKAAMIRKAKGTSGNSIDYVRRNFDGLKATGLDDPAVTELWEVLSRKGV